MIEADKPKLFRYSEGIASEGVIYVNDYSKGRAYRVGSDGRKLMPSKKPFGYVTPEDWKASTKAADDIARQEVGEEDRLAKEKKKEKKDKKGKKEKKHKEDDTRNERNGGYV